MSRVVIDPVGRTVRAGERVWPFEWEPAADTAAIVLDGRRFELHGMTWRQKCNLARAARKIGPSEEALGAALAGACLPPHTPLPDRADDRAVLIDLARWLVSDENVAHWEPATLARITVVVCRATQLTPQALDMLPAAEVESMWTVAHEEDRGMQAPALDAVPPGVTRIVVVPDPARAALPDAPTSSTPSSMESPVERADAGAAEWPTATASAERRVEPGERVARAARSTTTAAAPSESQVPASAPTTSVQPGRTPRVSMRSPVALPERPRVPRVTARIGRVTPRIVSPERPQRAGDTVRLPATLSRAGQRADSKNPDVAASREWHDEKDSIASIASSPRSAATQGTEPPVIEEPTSEPSYDPFMSDVDPFADHDRTAARAGLDRGGLFDDLERAAVEAGIDLEG